MRWARKGGIVSRGGGQEWQAWGFHSGEGQGGGRRLFSSLTRKTGLRGCRPAGVPSAKRRAAPGRPPPAGAAPCCRLLRPLRRRSRSGRPAATGAQAEAALSVRPNPLGLPAISRMVAQKSRSAAPPRRKQRLLQPARPGLDQRLRTAGRTLPADHIGRPSSRLQKRSEIHRTSG